MFDATRQSTAVDWAARHLAGPDPQATPRAETIRTLAFETGYLRVRVRHDGAGSVSVRFSPVAQPAPGAGGLPLYHGLCAGRVLISFRPGPWVGFLLGAARGGAASVGSRAPQRRGRPEESDWQQAA